MTIRDISRLTNVKNYKIDEAAKQIIDEVPSFRKKTINGRLKSEAHLSWEEVEAICKKLKLNELQIMVVKENFSEEPAPDIYEIPGTHKFLAQYKKNSNIKCCNTCKYLIGVTGTHKMPQPYCKVYEKNLSTFSARVYEDWCSSYCKCDLPKPRQWFKDTAPINLNMYGETETINGIEKSRLMNSKRSVPNTIIRVNQVGFDD